MTFFAGHLTYILIALSYLLRDILWLRIVALIASVLSVFFNYFAPSEPLWIPIGWNCLFVVINVYHLFYLLRRPRGDLCSEEINLAQTFFGGASPRQLSDLFRCGTWHDVAVGNAITRQGKRPGQIVVLYEGEVQVTVDGISRGTIQERTFLGEVAYLTQQEASATVETTTKSKILAWSVEDLQRLLNADEQLNSLFQNWLAIDLTRKLMRGDDTERERALLEV